jgi:hypothetical protein
MLLPTGLMAQESDIPEKIPYFDQRNLTCKYPRTEYVSTYHSLRTQDAECYGSDDYYYFGNRNSEYKDGRICEKWSDVVRHYRSQFPDHEL